MNGNAATASDSQQSEQIPECIWNINVICFFPCQTGLENEKNVLGPIQVELNHQNMCHAVDSDLFFNKYNSISVLFLLKLNVNKAEIKKISMLRPVHTGRNFVRDIRD